MQKISNMKTRMLLLRARGRGVGRGVGRGGGREGRWKIIAANFSLSYSFLPVRCSGMQTHILTHADFASEVQDEDDPGKREWVGAQCTKNSMLTMMSATHITRHTHCRGKPPGNSNAFSFLHLCKGKVQKKKKEKKTNKC